MAHRTEPRKPTAADIRRAMIAEFGPFESLAAAVAYESSARRAVGLDERQPDLDGAHLADDLCIWRSLRPELQAQHHHVDLLTQRACCGAPINAEHAPNCTEAMRRWFDGQSSEQRRPWQELRHGECDCIPEIGPSHCHLCGEAAGRPVEWSEAPCRVPTVDDALELFDAIEGERPYRDAAERAVTCSTIVAYLPDGRTPVRCMLHEHDDDHVAHVRVSQR